VKFLLPTGGRAEPEMDTQMTTIDIAVIIIILSLLLALIGAVAVGAGWIE
jgi:hypothetical protein